MLQFKDSSYCFASTFSERDREAPKYARRRDSLRRSVSIELLPTLLETSLASIDRKRWVPLESHGLIREVGPP